MKKTTADRLNEILDERKMKQVDILNLCQPICEKYNIKLNKNDLSQYISGKVVPKQDKLSVLAFALNVNEVWLMGYDVPKEKNGLSHDHIDKIRELKLTQEELKQVYEYALFIKSKRETK